MSVNIHIILSIILAIFVYSCGLDKCRHLDYIDMPSPHQTILEPHSHTISTSPMARITPQLLLPMTILVLLCISGRTESSFIESECSAATCPSLCVQSLSVYAATIKRSPRRLVLAALSVSLQRAESTQAFVSKLARFKGLKGREQAAIRDCLEEMSDELDRLSRSVKELKSMGSSSRAGGKDFSWHISNIETWVSAALTDGTTCVDGFSDKAMNGRIRNSIRARVSNLAQLTSNALALINHYAATN